MILLPGQDQSAPSETHPQLGQLLCIFRYSAKDAQKKLIVGVILAASCALLVLFGSEGIKPLGAIAGVIGVLMLGLGVAGLSKTGTVIKVYEAGIVTSRNRDQSMLLFSNVSDAQIDYLMKPSAMNITIQLVSPDSKARIADGYWKSNQETLGPAFEALVNHIATTIPPNVEIKGRHNIDRVEN